MTTKVQKWGNSLAIRIPKLLAEEAGLDQGTSVEVTREGDNLMVRGIKRGGRSEIPPLDDLLSRITDENIHEEVDFGAPAGKELI